MTRPAFTVTYEIVTPESAEHGDVAERGYALPGGWRFEQPADIYGDAAASFHDEHLITLREAVSLIGCNVKDYGRWFTSSPEQNYHTGEEETLSLHPPQTITRTSYQRLARILGAKS